MSGWRAPALLALALGSSSCAPAKALAPPPRHPGVAEELLPPDLDLVVRIDVAKLRRTLGPDALARATPFADGAVTRALAAATSVWLGFHGPPAGDRSDVVVVARGDFAGLDPTTELEASPSSGWRELGREPASRLYARAPGAARAAPVWMLVEGDRVLVVASAAEVDAVERAVRATSPRALEAPADGVVGVAARYRALAPAFARRFPELASVLADAKTARATLDADGGVLRFDVALAFVAESAAARGETVLRAWSKALGGESGLAGALGRAAEVARPSRIDVVVRVRIDANALRDATR